MPGDARNLTAQGVLGDGFGHIAIGPGGQKTLAVAGHGVGRDHQYRGVPPLTCFAFAQMAQSVKADFDRNAAIVKQFNIQINQ